MKKFFIFIFAMFGLMVGFVAIVLSGYYRDYEKFHNRSSFPEPKERLLEILVENRKFTQEEAEYAIEHAQVDWLN